MRTFSRASLQIACLLSFALLSGCGGVPVTTIATTNSVQGVALHGHVHGGEQPIAGASVYLYAASTTGYGQPSVSLLNDNVLNQLPLAGEDANNNYYVITDSNGNFTITGDYSCTIATTQVYLYAIGGNPGLAQGTDNTAAGLLAGLGTCDSLSSSTTITINEISTVATAYAVAGFATDSTHVSSLGSSLAQTDVMNAFATVTNLETLSTGVALATTPLPSNNGTVPQAEINTLANILASCTSTNGAITGGESPTACYTLFTNAENSSGTMPPDTATAAINIAHNPGANITNLWSLQTGLAPFQPATEAQPNDFTISINYTGGGIDVPYAIAVDASGNIWLANHSGNTISEFNSNGVPNSNSPFAGKGDLTDPQSIVVDADGNLWVGNETVSNNTPTISEFNSSGVEYSNSPFSGGGLDNPRGMAIDSNGDIWAADWTAPGDTISELSSSGSPISPSGPGGGYPESSLDIPYSIAVDASGHIWVVSELNTVAEFSSSGSSISQLYANNNGCLNDPVGGIAIDASGNAWVANYSGGGNICEYAPTGGSPNSYSGGGLDLSVGTAADGAGNIWVANYYNGYSAYRTTGSISEFTSGTAISGQYGYIAGGEKNGPYGIAIDGSGNAWVPNIGTSTLTEFIGVAVPVVTPMVANFLSPYAVNESAVNKP